jgi:hypothetical protein
MHRVSVMLGHFRFHSSNVVHTPLRWLRVSSVHSLHVTHPPVHEHCPWSPGLPGRTLWSHRTFSSRTVFMLDHNSSSSVVYTTRPSYCTHSQRSAAPVLYSKSRLCESWWQQDQHTTPQCCNHHSQIVRRWPPDVWLLSHQYSSGVWAIYYRLTRAVIEPFSGRWRSMSLHDLSGSIGSVRIYVTGGRHKPSSRWLKSPGRCTHSSQF